MMPSPITLTTLGLLLLGGVAIDYVGRHSFIPRVSALIMFGALAGPSCLDILPGMSTSWFPHIASMALVMIGFLLGSSLTVQGLKESGRFVLSISIWAVVVTAAIVGAGLYLIGVPLTVSLICGAISTSTDPAATLDVVHGTNTKSQASQILLRITAIDDAWGLGFFSLVLVVVQSSIGAGEVGTFLLESLWEISGACVLGLALGLPMSYLTGRLRPGEPTLLEAVGMVLLCGGLALWLHVSYILAAMVMGSVVANCAKHHTRPFRAIENLEWPIVVLFFIFSGASIRIADMSTNAVLIISYILLRSAGRIVGAKIGGRLSHVGQSVQNWVGVALMPQAGVALGTAFIASQRISGLDSIVTVIATATVFFEIVGPICTRFALRKME
jgi:Kef-type K+ transport system membrane component KefB